MVWMRRGVQAGAWLGLFIGQVSLGLHGDGKNE